MATGHKNPYKRLSNLSRLIVHTLAKAIAFTALSFSTSLILILKIKKQYPND